jgi:hypothetical protein
MDVIVPHHTTREEAMKKVDRSATDLFGGLGGASVTMTDPKKSWNGPVMDFSVTANAGFISLPLSGQVTVDDTNITIHCELPGLVNRFVGEEKVRAAIEGKAQKMFAA